MRLALFSIGLGLLGLLGGCAGPAAAAPWALPLAQEVTRKPVDLVVPNEDGSQYVMVEARPFSPKGEAKRKFVRSARKACKGDYMVMSENSATRRVGGMGPSRIHEGWVRCISPEAADDLAEPKPKAHNKMAGVQDAEKARGQQERSRQAIRQQRRAMRQAPVGLGGLN